IPAILHDVNSDETGMWARFGSSGNRFSIRIVSKRAFPLVVFGKSFRIFVRQGSQPPPKRAGRRMVRNRFRPVRRATFRRT
uniref:hypothetical protein n=1 Tax=Alistipes communis TaxID=2585118 RepID=UPI003FD71E2E